MFYGYHSHWTPISESLISITPQTPISLSQPDNSDIDCDIRGAASVISGFKAVISQLHTSDDIEVNIGCQVISPGGVLISQLVVTVSDIVVPGPISQYLRRHFYRHHSNSNIIAGRGPARADAEGWQHPSPWIPQFIASSWPQRLPQSHPVEIFFRSATSIC